MKLSRIAKTYTEQKEQPEPTLSKEEMMEIISGYNEYRNIIQGSKQIRELTETLKHVIENAKVYTLQETDEWSDNITVNRHMKQLDSNYKLFEKTAREVYVLNQRLEHLYEEIGQILDKYYEIK